MSGDDDEFRFGPADAGPAGDSGAAAGFDPVPAVIGLAVGGAGWALVAVGTALGSGVVLFAGFAVLLGGCLWLVAGLVAAG